MGAPRGSSPAAASENGLRGPLRGGCTPLPQGYVFWCARGKGTGRSTRNLPLACPFLPWLPWLQESHFSLTWWHSASLSNRELLPTYNHRISHTQLDKRTGSLLSRSSLDMSYTTFNWSTGHRASVWGPSQ